jgi:hypothetical protein
MALTERFENDKIEVVGPYKHVQVRKATVIERDGEEISRTFNRRLLVCGALNESDELVDTDISGEDADVQAICNVVWTTSVRDLYKAYLIANKPAS